MGLFMSATLSSHLSVEEVVLPSIGGVKIYAFDLTITLEQLNGFPLNLVWIICHVIKHDDEIGLVTFDDESLYACNNSRTTG